MIPSCPIFPLIRFKIYPLNNSAVMEKVFTITIDFFPNSLFPHTTSEKLAFPISRPTLESPIPYLVYFELKGLLTGKCYSLYVQLFVFYSWTPEGTPIKDIELMAHCHQTPNLKPWVLLRFLIPKFLCKWVLQWFFTWSIVLPDTCPH